MVKRVLNSYDFENRIKLLRDIILTLSYLLVESSISLGMSLGLCASISGFFS